MSNNNQQFEYLNKLLYIFFYIYLKKININFDCFFFFIQIKQINLI